MSTAVVPAAPVVVSGQDAAEQRLRVTETHTARLLFVDDRVLKWKRPVALGFVDFTTRESRLAACQAEVELNRRLAPDVYLGVATLVDPAGDVVEPAVLMRRLPDAAKLSSLVRAGRDVSFEVERLAKVLAAFHAGCERVTEAAAVAGSEALHRLWREGLDEIAGAPPDVLDPHLVADVRALATSYLAGRDQLFRDRIDAGRVRDGHGDLLAEDIFCLRDGPRVLDCLDFDPGLRRGDVLGDVAFLAMDLERLGAADMAGLLLRRYREHSGETHPPSLEHLYVAYRAQVRSKVALVRAGQIVDPARRRPLVAEARRLLELTRRHLLAAEVRLVLVGGLPGTGKSTIAALLAERTGAALHSSDAVRAELALPAEQRYDPASVDEVYRTMLDRARAGLERGVSTVLDATWLDERQRRAALEIAARTASRLVEVQLTAPPELALQRLARRGPSHASDADADVYRLLRERADAWPEASQVSTDGDLADAVEEVVARVERRPSAPLRPSALG